MQRFIVRFVMPFGLALLSSIVALSLTLLFDDPLTKPNFFLVFLIAVVFTAWYGRLSSGILATLLIAAGVAYFYLPPINSLHVGDPNDFERLLEFIATGLLVNFLIAALRSTQRQVKEAEALYKNAARRMAVLYSHEQPGEDGLKDRD